MRLHNPEAGEYCEYCAKLLKQAHPELQEWYKKVKNQFKYTHISCAYRNKEDQEKAFESGASKAHFPNSPHNHMVNWVPCALALDLFVIDEDGVTRWPYKFFQSIDSWNKENKEPILWGGTFKKLVDGPHFELRTNATYPTKG